MVMSIRLDRETEAKLERLARLRRLTRSQVVRDAIRLMAEVEPEESGERPTLYDLWKPMIGKLKGGPKDRARRHKEYFLRGLREKRRRGTL